MTAPTKSTTRAARAAQPVVSRATSEHKATPPTVATAGAAVDSEPTPAVASMSGPGMVERAAREMGVWRVKGQPSPYSGGKDGAK